MNRTLYLRITILTVMVLICISVTYLIAPNFVLSVFTPDINLDDENINGIHLNQNINELNTNAISQDKNNPSINYLSGIRLIKDENGNINNIAITHESNKTVKTSRGITVGDSIESVKISYGENYYNRTEQGVEIMVYVHNNKFIEFWHWNNEVQEIRFGLRGIE
ncbi:MULTISPECIES: hypothetical protein [Lysinibacillus]|uniref:Uncharacterized protein n=1 Tax=Lysinibacillus antri TaxID=2498145 RepID=A0A432LD74_9BACI|nr:MULTISPECIES: hypothetical protein [Lysinibacillus]RUL54052.1 hypothetical protein EK386_07975 [Lysinibacillus antri]TSI02560.1 hypothetical protein FJQ64_18370 [Lysinibacillus sp. BW-2-10]